MRKFWERSHRRRTRWSWWVLGAMLCLTPLTVLSLSRIHLENNIQNWLPPDDPQAKTLRWYFAHFPYEDRLLVSWDGSSLNDPRVARFSRRLAGTTDENGNRQGGLKQIRRAIAPQNLIDRMVHAGVGRDEALRRLQGVLIGRGPAGPVAVSVTLSDEGSVDKPATLRAIRQVAEEVGIEPDQLHMGGQVVAATALNHAVGQAVWNGDADAFQIHKRSVLLLSAVVGIVLAFVMLRSIRLATLVLVVSFCATLIATAIVPVAGGSMNMVLVVMPPLLMVLSISAAIHVANYWKHAAHRDPRTAVAEAVKMAKGPCTLASVTTAIGLLSLMTSPLTPVRDFGLFAAIGCLVSVAMALLGLPALLDLWPSRAPRKSDIDAIAWRRFGLFISRHSVAITVLSIAVFAVSTYGLRWFRTETKNIRNFREDSRIVQDYRFLEQNLAGVVPVEVIVRFDTPTLNAQNGLDFTERMELVRKLGDQLRQHPEVSGTLSLADFLPMTESPPAMANTMTKLLYNRKVNEIEKRIRQDGTSAAFLTVAADLNVAGDQRLNKAGDELWKITAQVAILSDTDYGQLTGDIHRIVESVLESQPGTAHVVTGMIPLFLRTQRAVLDSLIKSFAIAFALIAVVMMIVLRNPAAGLIGMLPNLLPIGAVFGLISWFGLSVNIGTMITASVALGIAVDGTLHLLTWFRAGIADGLTRDEAAAHALAHCGPAMWQTSLAVGVGLLMLYPADLLLISRFGWLMAALIAVALLADIIFLPALLAGPLGRLLQQSTPRSVVANDSHATVEVARRRKDAASA